MNWSNALIGVAIVASMGLGSVAWTRPMDVAQSTADDMPSRLAQARRLVQSGHAPQALELLGPFEPAMAGNPAFDYVIGLAYLDSGEPTRAIFALERVIAIEPQNAKARAELARAHLALGEKEEARREFAAAAGEADVPPEARRALNELTQILGPATAPPATRYQLLASAAMGYDSNINSASEAEFISIPAFAGLGLARLSSSALAKSAALSDTALDFEAVHGLSSSFALAGGADIDRRWNVDAEPFDLTTMGFHVGGVATDGDRTISFAMQGQDTRYDRTDLRQALGLTAEYQIPLNPKLTMSPYVQEFYLTYPFDPTRQVWRSGGGVALAQALEIADLEPVLFGGFYGGTETAHEAYAYNGHRFLGGRLGTEMNLWSGTRLIFAAAYENRAYGGIDPIFEYRRTDRQWDLALGLTVDLGNNWSLRPDLTWTRAQSTLPINDYRRWTALIGISKALH